jgi:hypothetical protein
MSGWLRRLAVNARGGDARGGDARGGDARGGDARGGIATLRPAAVMPTGIVTPTEDLALESVVETPAPAHVPSMVHAEPLTTPPTERNRSASAPRTVAAPMALRLDQALAFLTGAQPMSASAAFPSPPSARPPIAQPSEHAMEPDLQPRTGAQPSVTPTGVVRGSGERPSAQTDGATPVALAARPAPVARQAIPTRLAPAEARAELQAPPAPDIHIHIGRIELSAPPAPVAVRREPGRGTKPPLSLDDYLRRRDRQQP